MVKNIFYGAVFYDFLTYRFGQERKKFMMGGFTLHSAWCTR